MSLTRHTAVQFLGSRESPTAATPDQTHTLAFRPSPPTPGSRVSMPAAEARRFVKSRIFLEPFTDAVPSLKPYGRPRARGAILDSPVLVGILLFAFPPVGLAVLWSSPRYSAEARAAITLSSLFLFAVVAVIYIAGR